MSDTTIWLLIVGVAAGTYLIRASFIQAWQWISVPPALARALRYVPPAVFAALVLPALVVADGGIDLSPDNPRLVAGLAAAVVAWYSRNVLLTIGVGMGGLWLLQAAL
ncbi:MAG: AzlD domain-containing protein [Halofilum sp. (in: g-proteobacteria)]|nr:AzlD domain-containing protein [Halofilum sp. (in: g-proteobacteria)]